MADINTPETTEVDVETLMGLVEITWARLEDTHRFSEKFGVQGDALLDEVRSKLGMAPKPIAIGRLKA